MLISSKSQPGIIADKMKNQVGAKYSGNKSGDSSRSIKKLAKFKIFKNLKAKNH